MEAFAEELKERNEAIAKLAQELNTNRIAYQTAMDTLVEMTEKLSKTKQALDLAVDTMERMKKVVDNSDISEPLFGLVTTNVSFELLNTLKKIKQITETKDVK